MRSFAVTLAAFAAFQSGLAQYVGPQTVLAAGSCLSENPVLFPAPTTGFRCGNPVSPRMRYQNHATIIANSTLDFQPCATSCVNNDLCKAFTFQSSTSSCTTYAHGGGYVGREPMLVNPAPGFAFYNRHCFHQLQCFNLQGEDDASTTGVESVTPTNMISYTGDYVTQRMSSDTNFAQFESALTSVCQENFYLLADGKLVSDNLALPAANVADTSATGTYTTVYFPTTAQSAGTAYDPLTCNVDQATGTVTCTSGNGSQFYGCSSAKTTLTGNGLALGLPSQQTDNSLRCNPVILNAVNF